MSNQNQTNSRQRTAATASDIRRHMLQEMGAGWEPIGELAIENERLNVRARWSAMKRQYNAIAPAGHETSYTAWAHSITEAVNRALKMRSQGMR